MMTQENIITEIIIINNQHLYRASCWRDDPGCICIWFFEDILKYYMIIWKIAVNECFKFCIMNVFNLSWKTFDKLFTFVWAAVYKLEPGFTHRAGRGGGGGVT